MQVGQPSHGRASLLCRDPMSPIWHKFCQNLFSFIQEEGQPSSSAESRYWLPRSRRGWMKIFHFFMKICMQISDSGFRGKINVVSPGDSARRASTCRRWNVNARWNPALLLGLALLHENTSLALLKTHSYWALWFSKPSMDPPKSQRYLSELLQTSIMCNVYCMPLYSLCSFSACGIP